MAGPEGRTRRRGVPEDEDAACRAGLESWLARVLSSKGRVASSSLEPLLELEADAKDLAVARMYVDRALKSVMPSRNVQGMFDQADPVIREHSRIHNYQLGTTTLDRFGYWIWEIDVADQDGAVRLVLNGEVSLLTFPDGFTWPEFAQVPADARDAVRAQLRRLDAYTDPRTRLVRAKRRLRPPRTELQLSDGTVLWRGGGRGARE